MVHTGEQTPQALWLNMESHKLHEAFTAGGTIYAAQPVKLQADGTIVALGAADAAYLILGHALRGGVALDELTIAMRGHARITVESGAAAQVAGPVKWASYNATTGRNVYVAALDAATTQALAIEGGDAGDEIEIVLL